MTDRKKLLFTVDEMTMGGVSRVLNTLMNELPEDKYEIDLLILHKRGMLLEEIPQKVHVIEGTPFFNCVDESLRGLLKRKDFRKVCSKLRLLFYMKTGLIKKKIQKERKKMLAKQYDTEVAAKEGFCTIFTAYGDSKRKLNWVLTDYSVRNYSGNHMHLVKESLKKIDLNIADSEHALVAYETVFRVRNGITIHNLMQTEKIEEGKKEAVPEMEGDDGLKVIAVARFHPQKSLDRLIRASHEACQKGLKHTLYLIGGGMEENMLYELVNDLHMENVRFLGYKQNPYAYMARADLYVLSSLYEGFATVISESLICETPVLTTEVSGCEEQITKKEYGWIVENSQEGLNQGLIHALENPEYLKKMKQDLKNYHYPNEEILKKFEKVL